MPTVASGRMHFPLASEAQYGSRYRSISFSRIASNNKLISYKSCDCYFEIWAGFGLAGNLQIITFLCFSSMRRMPIILQEIIYSDFIHVNVYSRQTIVLVIRNSYFKEGGQRNEYSSTYVSRFHYSTADGLRFS